jgi:effector-binding domain-containing protein
MDFEKIIFDPKTYLGIRKVLSFDEMKAGKTYEYVFGKVMQYLSTHGLSPVGAPVSIYYSWDEPNQQTEMGIGFPVEGLAELDDPELTLMTIEESKAVKAVHKGDYMKLKDTHDQLMKYLQENNLQYDKYAIEEYLTDAKTEPDVSKWITNVYYMVK